MPESIDLTPFGFTTTESQVYGALLRLGPSTGYAVAHAVRIARANTYGALEGLAGRSAALRLRVAGETPAEAGTLVAAVVPVDTPTMLLIDDGQAVVASGAGEEAAALWSSHPAILAVVRVALRSLA